MAKNPDNRGSAPDFLLMVKEPESLTQIGRPNARRDILFLAHDCITITELKSLSMTMTRNHPSIPHSPQTTPCFPQVMDGD
jgi:hypothetical protein